MAAAVTLLASTGDVRADEILHATLAAYEAALPGRVRASYLHGSQVDGTGVPTSDLDLAIIVGGRLRPGAETRAARRLRARCIAASPLELDIELTDEAALARGMDPTLKLGARLLSGVELRDAFPIMPLDDWARDRLHTSAWRIIHLFGRPLPVSLPLSYPDPADEFLGYLRRQTRLPDGRQEPGTRDLIRSAGWAATALLGLRARIYVARKRDCHRLYREHIGEQWADLLTALYERCRGAWHYRIPDVPAERRELRAICASTLGFENAFLASYRDFVLAELRGATAVQRRRARAALARVPFDDVDIVAALQSSRGAGRTSCRA